MSQVVRTQKRQAAVAGESNEVDKLLREYGDGGNSQETSY